MRWRWIVVGIACTAAAAGCATSEGVTGGPFDGGAATGGGFDGGAATGGVGGGTAGSANGGASGGLAGSGGVAGGSAGSSATGGTGASGGGGTGGGNCSPPVAGGACDTFPQCGCGSGLVCNVTQTSGITSCVLPGNVTPYNACVALNDCQGGYACVGGACKAFCEADPDCAQTSGACFQVNDNSSGSSVPIPGMKICSKKCAPENPAAACGPGLSCYVDNSVTPAQTDCSTAGTATGPGVCASDNTVCAPGYVCLTSGACRKWCRVGFSSDCGGSACTGFTTPLIVDGLEYGACP
jgi:hypothetical protein